MGGYQNVGRELFPRAMVMQPDPSGAHLWAEFHAEEALRVSLLYDTAAELRAVVREGFEGHLVAGAGLWRCLLRIPR